MSWRPSWDVASDLGRDLEGLRRRCREALASAVDALQARGQAAGPKGQDFL